MTYPLNGETIYILPVQYKKKLNKNFVKLFLHIVSQCMKKVEKRKEMKRVKRERK